MASNVLPYSVDIEHMSIGCMVSSSVSTVILLQVLSTFALFRNRVDCCFNRFIVIFCSLQLVQCVQKIVFCSITILNEGLPFIACDINASLDQFLDFSSMCFLIAFFIGMSNARSYWESSWNATAYVVAPVLGLCSLGTVWALLADRVPGVTYDDAPYFTQDLAWCWIPDHRTGELDLIKNSGELKAVQLFLGYLPTVLVIVTAVYAYLNQRCRTGESWLGKGVILRRFLGTSIFPILIYIIGMPIRISFASNANLVAVLISTVYPLTGAIVGLVFLWTEGGLTWIPRLALRKLCCQGGLGTNDIEEDATVCPPTSNQGQRSDGLRDIDQPGLDRQYSDAYAPSPSHRRSSLGEHSSTPSSPRRSGLSGIQDSWLHSQEAVPTSFTATLRAMMCDAVVGQHVASSRAAYYSAHYGRIISDRNSIADSVTTTESNFAHTHNNDGGGEGVEFSTYLIQIDPSSRRTIPRRETYGGGGPRNVNGISDSRDSFARELVSQARHSQESARSSNSKFTTRSELSMQYISPPVRVHDSMESPSSSLLLAYRPSVQRQSSDRLREASPSPPELENVAGVPLAEGEGGCVDVE